MKTKYIFASLLLSSLAFTGCEDMDTLPEGNIVTSNQKDEIGKIDPTKVEARVNAIFAQFSLMTPNKGALQLERHNDFGYPSVMLFTDANGNDVVTDDNGYNWMGDELSYTDRSQTSLSCQIIWNDMYAIIYAANNVAKEIDPATSDATEQYFLSQGLGARAFSYWVLAQLFQFNYKGNESKPCVPLITDKNMEAAANEGISPAGMTDVNKPAFWTVSEKNWMWGIIVNETDEIVSSGIVNWPSHMGSLNFGYANFSGGLQISKSLYNQIPNTDVRKGWWLGGDLKSKNLSASQQAMVTGYGYKAYTQVKFAPYNNVLETSINANDIPLMRVEEMYLIKAEAEAMSGQDGKKTLEDFIKKYRNESYVVSNSDIQEEVFLQRRIELWGEGLNWFDVMRLNKGVDRRGAGFPNDNMIFNIAPTDPILLWPIPQAEIQANQALSAADQNPTSTTPKPVEDK